jgi:uncharacterized protein with von Willebrand factor type A (vWA) domain
LKTLTLAISPKDNRRSEVIEFVRNIFPDIQALEFRTELTAARPHAVALTPSDNIADLLSIEAALLKQFPVRR